MKKRRLAILLVVGLGLSSAAAATAAIPRTAPKAPHKAGITHQGTPGPMW